MISSRLTRLSRWTCLLALAAFAGLGLAACAESESTVEKCTTSADCSQFDQVCFEGVCQGRDEPRPCMDSAECLQGESCVSGFCGDPVVEDMTMADTTTMDMTSDDTTTTTTTTTAPTDMGMDILDNTPPTVVSRTPDEGATGVALDATLTIEFSEELIDATVNSDTITVTDPSNRAVATEVVYDDTTLIATVTFTEGLAPWTTYEVTATTGILDLAQLSLAETAWSFATTEPAGAGFQAELAQAYAPVLYLDAENTSRDVPTAIDYDGDLNPGNNADNVASTPEPTVYYHVTWTESHYFIHYVLYFPAFKLGSAAPTQEHAVTAVLVVADRSSRLGALRFFETYSIGNDPGRIDAFLPDCSMAAGDEPFCPLGFAPQSAATDRFHDIPATAYAEADGRRVRVYARHLNHNLCHWAYENTGAGYCGKDAEAFSQSDNAIIEAAAAGGTGSVDFANNTGTYTLVNIAEPWWTQRDDVSAETEAFYASARTYTTSPTSIGGANDQRVPSVLGTEDMSNNSGRFAPWAFAVSDGLGVETGQWFVDPASATSSRYSTLPDPFENRGNKYCYSMTFGVDRSSDAECAPAAP